MNIIKNFFQNKKRFLKFIFSEKINKKITEIAINPLLIETLNYKNILVFAPHIDDEMIGCGGTLLKIKKENNANIQIFYLKKTDERIKEAEEVCKKCCFEIIDSYQKTINMCDLIFLPSFLENHKTHILTFHTIINNLKVFNYSGDIFLYNIWSILFPNIVIDISDYINEKLECIKFYKSQLISKNYVHITRGLNAYYSIYLPQHQNNEKYAEIFFKTNINEINLIKNFF
ncbi:MAG TPA: hypothetical protein PLD27_03980 [bacterium]|nr:hypothetical protein [bacterium]HOL47788.1 hypothetical protein [bacterium]HPQ18623.1 hypothetical protein [bacterium]